MAIFWLKKFSCRLKFTCVIIDSYFIKLFDAGLQCEFIRTFNSIESTGDIFIFFAHCDIRCLVYWNVKCIVLCCWHGKRVFLTLPYLLHKDQINAVGHSTEIGGLCLMKCYTEIRHAPSELPEVVWCSKMPKITLK